MKIVLERRGSQERRQRIAIDMDEVMADALTEHLRRYNAAYGTSITAAELSGQHLEQCIPRQHIVRPPKRCSTLPSSRISRLLPDRQEVVRELADRYEVFIASPAMDVPCSFDAKYPLAATSFSFIAVAHRPLRATRRSSTPTI